MIGEFNLFFLNETKPRFGEGDIGLPGGIQIMEPAQLHPQHRESIHRYGGVSFGRLGLKGG